MRIGWNLMGRLTRKMMNLTLSSIDWPDQTRV